MERDFTIEKAFSVPGKFHEKVHGKVQEIIKDVIEDEPLHKTDFPFVKPWNFFFSSSESLIKKDDENDDTVKKGNFLSPIRSGLHKTSSLNQIHENLFEDKIVPHRRLMNKMNCYKKNESDPSSKLNLRKIHSSNDGVRSLETHVESTNNDNTFQNFFEDVVNSPVNLGKAVFQPVNKLLTPTIVKPINRLINIPADARRSRASTNKTLVSESGSIGRFSIEYASDKKNAEFHKLFENNNKINEEEKLILDVVCTLSLEIFTSGKMYITNRNVCFYSNIFGWINKLVIPFDDIIKIDKKSLVGIIPNSIVVETTKEKREFSSFLNRDTVFDLLNNVWHEARKPESFDESVMEEDETMIDQEINQQLEDENAEKHLMDEVVLNKPIKQLVDAMYGDEPLIMIKILESQNCIKVGIISNLIEDKKRSFSYTINGDEKCKIIEQLKHYDLNNYVEVQHIRRKKGKENTLCFTFTKINNNSTRLSIYSIGENSEVEEVKRLDKILFEQIEILLPTKDGRGKFTSILIIIISVVCLLYLFDRFFKSNDSIYSEMILNDKTYEVQPNIQNYYRFTERETVTKDFNELSIDNIIENSTIDISNEVLEWLKQHGDKKVVSTLEKDQIILEEWPNKELKEYEKLLIEIKETKIKLEELGKMKEFFTFSYTKLGK